MIVTTANADRVRELLNDFVEDRQIPLDVRMQYALRDFEEKRKRMEKTYNVHEDALNGRR